MVISKELKKLSSLFPTKLYVVGGAVRDSLLGYELSDYDLSSSLMGEEVIELLKDTEFKVTPHSLKLGTLGIKVGKTTMEYTAFRKDSYSKTGEHGPEKVEFNVGILEDAKRRDFTINAIYYDVEEEKIVDPLGGVKDLERGVITTTRDPEEVFEEDALRILRMVRFSASLGFEIEDETFLASQKRAYTISTLAPERIQEELNKILVSDTLHGIKDAHIRSIIMLVKCGAIEQIIPELLEGIGVAQPKKYHAYDVYNHVLHTLRVAPPHLRLVALLHDIGKPRSIDEEGHMTEHPYVGAQMARDILMRLRYPIKDIERITKLIEIHMYDVKCIFEDSAVRIFILRNHELFEDLILLKQADFLAHGIQSGESPTVTKLKRLMREMKENSVAFTLKELPIDGRTLIELRVSPKERAKTLNSVLEYGAYLGRALTKEECISYVLAH